MLSRLIAVAVLCCASLACAAAADLPPNPALAALFDREFQNDLQEFPENAPP